MDNTEYGSIWRKWDLHIHSKYSQEEQAKLEIVDIFRQAIRSKIEVISITDHSNVDGLDEIWQIWESQSVEIDGKNIKISEVIEFLPGCELKTDMGKHGVHLIAVFPKQINGTKVDKSYLEQQLLAKINCSHQDVIDKGNGVFNNGLFLMTVDFEKTSELVHALGGLIIVHAGQKSNGIEKEMAHAKDETDSYQLLNSLGAKKTDLMVHYIDICELPNTTEGSLKEAEFYLKKFNKPSIVSSDSHSTYDGVVYTWIKSDPTLQGLKQIMLEPADRVCLEKIPPVIDRVSANKTKYIHKLRIKQIQGYDGAQGEWFKDVEIPFNSELVAIIGNKGSGKSALADILGLLGDTEKSAHFSFLKDGKFLKKGYAQNFVAELTWKDESPSSFISLSQSVDKTRIPKVRYLPQNYFESLTNSLNSENFEKTLRDVIFSNIPEADRLGMPTFDELEKLKKKNIDDDLRILTAELSEINENIVELETKQHPEYIARITNLITVKQNELDEHLKTKPKTANDPNKSSKKDNPTNKAQSDKLLKLNQEFSKYNSDIDTKKQDLLSLKQNEQQIISILGSISRFKAQYSQLLEDNREKLKQYGIDIEKTFKFIVKTNAITEKLQSIKEEIRTTELLISDELKINSDATLSIKEKAKSIKSSLLVKQSTVKNKIDKLKISLSKPEKEYQEYRENHEKWLVRKKEIEGTKNLPEVGTLLFLQQEHTYITKSLSADITKLYQSRINKTETIFHKKSEILTLYNKLKVSIDQQLTSRSDLIQKFKIEIRSGFVLDRSFPKKFLDFIHKSKSGTFRAAGELRVLELFKDKSLTSLIDIKSILDQIISLLNEDKSEHIEKGETKRYISDQIASVKEFYDYIYSLEYLIPVYDLRLDTKKLEELSPGERGALLLVFYLIIDKEDIPLIIDQPEDNLDNKSVYEILTHFIRLAKSRRQIIIVTHNPNLAVGADAEQIIYVEIDKKGKSKFLFEPGSIENPKINNRIVEILEGTMPAFEKRELRYLKII